MSITRVHLKKMMEAQTRVPSDVRCELIPDGEFDRILKAGFAPILGENLTFRSCVARFFGTAGAIRATNCRNDGLSSVPRTILHAQCALRLLESVRHHGIAVDQRGRPSRSSGCAHPARSVKRSDSVRNGLALSGTVHWMFDRGLVSIGDDYQILVAKNHVPEDAVRLLNKNGVIHLPKNQTLYPNAHYLKFHRDQVFKG